MPCIIAKGKKGILQEIWFNFLTVSELLNVIYFDLHELLVKVTEFLDARWDSWSGALKILKKTLVRSYLSRLHFLC